MSLPASDSFAGTVLSANWTVDVGTFAVASGIVTTTTTADSLAHWNADAFPNDQYSQVTILSAFPSNSKQAGVIVRATNSNNFYMARAQLGGSVWTTEIACIHGGSFVSFANNSTSWAVNDVMKLQVVGNVLTLLKNAVSVLTFTDSSNFRTSGSAGIYTGSTATTPTPGLGVWSGGGVYALPTLVQSKAAQSAGALSSVSVTFGNPIAAGNTILAHVTCRDATTGANTYTVTDNINSGAYTVDASNGGGGNYYLAIQRKSSAAAGTPTVTMTATGATPAGHLSIVVQEWSGLAPTSPVDQAVNNFNTVLNNSPTSGTTPALSQAQEPLISCAVEVSSTTWTPGAGFTMDPTTINGLGGFFAVEYGFQPTTAGNAATYTIGTTTLWQAVAVAYRSATPNLGGQSANFSQGSPSRSLAAPLTARTITSTVGAISEGLSKTLTGQTATFGEGSIFNAVTLSGQTATFSAPGTITKFISGPVTTAISGLSASFGQGTLTLSVGYLLDSNFVIMVGQTANFGMGAITATVTPVITGRTATFVEGSLNAGVVSGPSYTLVGRTATFSPGNIAAILPGSVTTQLSGQTATFTEGVPIFAPSYALAASTITSSEGVITFSTSNNIAFLLGSQTASFTNGLIVQAFPGGMPNVVGYLVQEATLILEQSGVLQPKKLNYFSTYPITYHWVRSKQRPSTVLAQSVPVGMTYTVNMPITLTLSEFPFSVSPGR